MKSNNWFTQQLSDFYSESLEQLMFSDVTFIHRKQKFSLCFYLQKLPYVHASTAANQPLHTPIRPFTRASRPISSLGGVTEEAEEKKTDRTTRLLLTNESAAMSHTPPRINQLPSRWRHGRNGPGGGQNRV